MNQQTKTGLIAFGAVAGSLLLMGLCCGVPMLLYGLGGKAAGVQNGSRNARCGMCQHEWNLRDPGGLKGNFWAAHERKTPCPLCHNLGSYQSFWDMYEENKQDQQEQARQPKR